MKRNRLGEFAQKPVYLDVYGQKVLAF